MATSQHEIDLISHCIQFMSNKDVVGSLFGAHGLEHAGLSYEKLAEEFENHPESLSIEDITREFRRNWTPCDVERQMSYLKSGRLDGHDWHGAKPSFLHRSIQDRVRECCQGTLTLEEYLAIGKDIFAHEYFTVATHDICESSIILSDDSVIPPIGKKSLTDFVHGGIPFDLKVTKHPPLWKERAGSMTRDEKKQLALELYERADSARLRETAEKCKHNWGLNRMYYLVADQDKWLTAPEETVAYLLSQLGNPDNYFDIVVQGHQAHICFIEQ